ncbi:MAG: hypothetical protein EXX96DRAFT_545723 [Benjaminiella poitrasii]|nr:MAG: hypothetical protein EXX96DRAFT_545723 [Benjaminiella poitrasii]
MISYLSLVTLTLISAVSAQVQTLVPETTTINNQPIPSTTVSPNGFNDVDNNIDAPHESWLKKNDRYVFIIVLALLFLAIIIWYIVRSIRSMRKRLAAENHGHMMMIQNASGVSQAFSETVPVNDGFHKIPDYPGHPLPQQQQQYMHRY